MSTEIREGAPVDNALEKVGTGVSGLDHITFGGLPRGRTTLVAGGPGCGKTLLGIEFICRGATDYGEPGVLITFEEDLEDLRMNAKSIGCDLNNLMERGLCQSRTRGQPEPDIHGDPRARRDHG